jgi:hypothetical protein
VTSEGLRYIPDMALDALTFLLLHNLGSLKATRGKVKEDGYNLADWIARLAKFVAAGGALKGAGFGVVRGGSLGRVDDSPKGVVR